MIKPLIFRNHRVQYQHQLIDADEGCEMGLESIPPLSLLATVVASSLPFNIPHLSDGLLNEKNNFIEITHSDTEPCVIRHLKSVSRVGLPQFLTCG